MKEKGDNIRSRHSTFVSYPLPSYGGTPPILRGEHHADSIQHGMSVK